MLLVMRMMRNRVESARVERMATADAFRAQPGAAQCAMSFDGFDRVVRARRIETTTRSEQRAQDQLVGANQNSQDVAHVLATRCQRVARLARNVVAGAWVAGNFAATTMSTAGSSSCASRNDSRTSRRRRFRRTALPAVFTATASPMRGNPRPLGLTRNPKKRSSMRRPEA